MEKVLKFFSAIFALIMAFCGVGQCEIGANVPSEDLTRIMSFNVRYNEWERGKIVPQLIADYYPDSVGVQECEALWFYHMKAYLPQYDIVGVGRLTGTRGGLSGEMSAILYRKDKYKVVDSDTFWLSETPDKVSKGWDGQKNRICTWAVLENLETGERYAHLNAHLDHQGENAKKNGLALVLEKAQSFDMPVVITGDFNFEKGTELYSDFAKAGFSDTQDMAEETMYGKTYHANKGGEDGLPIDFIMVNNEINDVKTYKIIRDQVDGGYISDHYPIFSDMIF
ncbi:MAG: endonuclease/exonuclease/phosphatase family protein [Clostridia bacterium]|nr:endonuclease/exonuclease/phosphatase family protein [Oscillospiraceae bacterium]MBQ2829207.1 endonuclease/exonuclease/phosphatase family protein [Clostridia bacterium]